MPGFFAICHLAVSGRSILLVLEKHQTTAQGGHMKDFLMSINRLQIWRQRVSLWGNIFVPPTLDRLAALWLHQRGMLGVREKLFLERFIQPGMIVADVGANQGIFTLLCAGSVGSGTVFAFEPEPVLFDSLQRNIKRNGIENVRAFPKAAASTRSRAKLVKSGLNSGDNRIVSDKKGRDQLVEIETIPLDDLLGDHQVNLLKIDTQGYELQVLRGCTKLLERNPEICILLEFWPFGLVEHFTRPEELLSFLGSRGFAVSELDRTGACVPFSFDADCWSGSRKYTNLVAQIPPDGAS
jgi:FkbM family methyltransferase